MPVLVVSKFEPEDLDGPATRRTGKAIAILAGVLLVPLGLTTTGTVLLALNRGVATLPAMMFTGFLWLMTVLAVKNVLRPKRVAPEELERWVRLMSPMRIELDPDRLRVEMPIGRSAYAYDSIASWWQTAKMGYVELKRDGAFRIPRRCLPPATEAEVAAFFKQKGVKIVSR